MTESDREDKISMMLNFMEWDYLSDSQHDLIIDFENQFKNRGSLSDKQYEILQSIFNQAAQKFEWSR
jgi:hypothetical protein